MDDEDKSVLVLWDLPFSGLPEKLSALSWQFLERYSPAKPVAMFHSEWPHWSCWIQNMPFFKVGSVFHLQFNLPSSSFLLLCQFLTHPDCTFATELTIILSIIRYGNYSASLLKTLNRKALKYEIGFDSQWSLFRRAMKAAS